MASTISDSSHSKKSTNSNNTMSSESSRKDKAMHPERKKSSSSSNDNKDDSGSSSRNVTSSNGGNNGGEEFDECFAIFQKADQTNGKKKRSKSKQQTNNTKRAPMQCPNPTPRKTQTRVSFNKRVLSHRVLPLQEYTEVEKFDCWYTNDEYQAIFKAVAQQVKKINSGHQFHDKKYSNRGLEAFSKANARAIQNTKRNAVKAVLHEQSSQWKKGISDPSKIAAYYTRYSSCCVETARIVGEQDAEDIKKYLSKDHKEKEQRKSKKSSSRSSSASSSGASVITATTISTATTVLTSADRSTFSGASSVATDDTTLGSQSLATMPSVDYSNHPYEGDRQHSVNACTA